MMSYGPGQCPDMQALRDQGELCEACRYFFLQGYYYRCNLHKSKQESKPMKKYICKIDSPWGNKGELAIFDSEFNPWNIDPSRYPDLFEEIPNRWVPEEGDDVYFINLMSKKYIIDYTTHLNSSLATHKDAYYNYNVFRTKEKAEEVLKKILQVLEENKEV